MKFFRLTLGRKLFLSWLLLIVASVLAAILVQKFKPELFDVKLFLIILSVVFVLGLLMHVYLVERPLYMILHQMEAMLSGRPYKKIFTERVDEIGVLAHFFDEVAANLSSFTGKLQEGERMSEELQTAAQLQRSILPLNAPVVPGLLVTAKMRPAAEVGGDNFDFLTVGDHTLFYIGDVTGHGVPAGLIMTMVNMLIYTYAEMFESPYDVVVHVNQQLKRRIQAGRFMTMVMMKWDHANRKLSYVGAGHEHILVFRQQTGVVDVIKSGGIALGMVADNSKLVQEIPLDLAEGDIVVLYSDGITEARNNAGEMFGLQRLQESVQRYASQYNPEGMAQHIADDVGHFIEGHAPDDDMSLIIVKNIGNKAVDPKEQGQNTGWTQGNAV